MPESRLPAADSAGFRVIDRIRVRYAETDQMGYAYYGHAATWFELARTGLLRLAGRTYRSIEEQDELILPVLEMNIVYHQAAHYDDELTLLARCDVSQDHRGRPSRLRFRMEFQICRDTELLYEGHTLHCFLRRDTRRPANMPSWFLELLQQLNSSRGDQTHA